MKNLITILFIVVTLLPASKEYDSCSIPLKFHSQENVQNDQNDQIDLTILSLNTWGLPIKLAKYKQNTRFKEIPDALNNTNTDIICLQECFSESLRKNILKNISAAYTHSTDYTCNRRSAGVLKLDCYGGLMTFSKHPIVDEHFYQFPKYEGSNFIEKIGRKGFLISQLDLGYKHIYVINTHLYSGHSRNAELLREQQVAFIWQTLDELEIREKDLILAGDLNFSHPKVMKENKLVSTSNIYNSLISEYGFIDGNKDEQYTLDPASKYCSSKDGKQILDYILLKPAKDQFASLSSSVVLNNNETISDHFGVHAHLKLNPHFESYSDEVIFIADKSLTNSMK